MTMADLRLDLSQEMVRDFCKKWLIDEFAVFGSVLRSDFGPDSDLDVLVSFSPEAEWGLLDHLRMEQELVTLLNRKVDLVTRRAVEQSHNWIRRDAILSTVEVIYAA
jgi:predicted nucleotidyltransferase